MSEPTDLLIAPLGAGVQITLNVPARGNGVTNDMALRLTGMLQRAGDHAAFVVLRGAGEDFCTGRFGTKPVPGARTDALSVRRHNDVIFDCYQSFRTCAVPIVGVVQGRALGFGASIAALCDITLAADTATFQIPEMNNPVLPTMAMSSLIDRVAPKNIAYLVLTRESIIAERAREMHIVSEVVPASHLETRVNELVALFDITPAVALQGAKDYLRVAANLPIASAVDFARNLHATVNSSPDIRA